MSAKPSATVAIEPALLDERDAAQFLSVSPRLFRELIRRGEVHAIKIPGARRITFEVAELRALVEQWKAGALR